MIYGMGLWADLALNLIDLKPHKRLFFLAWLSCSIPYRTSYLATLLLVKLHHRSNPELQAMF